MTQTVLVVDDHDGFRHQIRGLLERHGYRVIEAVDGGSAVRRAAEDRPDLALVDVHLPDLNGFQVAARLRTLGSPRWIILTSTHRRDDYGELLAGSAADGFIDKADLSAESIASLLAVWS